MYIGQLYIHIMYCQHISKHPKKQTVQPWFETMNLGGPNSFHKHPVGVPKDRRQHQPALAQWSFFIAGVCAKAVTLLQRLEDETNKHFAVPGEGPVVKIVVEEWAVSSGDVKCKK